MWKYMLCLLVLSTSNVAANCPQVSVESDLNTTGIIGSWYETARFPNSFEDVNLSCVKINQTQASSSIFHISFVGILNGEKQHIIGKATVNDNPAKWTLSVNKPKAFDGPFWITSTDYSTYMTAWSCTKSEDGRDITEAAWIMTRKQSIKAHELASILKELAAMGIPVSNFNMTTQTGC
eukprot:TRINITY_DN1221_c0_g1_i1.p1 TRINITY_DN1221_c0_g1~~TRINITY_DN1221_c0_g1_i1.p1  ORF type:complete len:206 (-),score=24.81 TRINITY_DN1221_c0_g1_i1:29-565(-)